MDHSELANDQQVMRKFHYRQELRRTIHLFGSFAVAFSFISVTTGVFANYELVLDQSGPAGFWTWPIVILGQTLVALIFADLCARMPLTGYSYQWVRRIAGKGWGWFAGWVSVCFLIVVIPSVDHGIASVLSHISRAPPESSQLRLIVCGLIVLQAGIQIFGVRLADRINSAAVFTEVLGIIGLVLIFGVSFYRDPPAWHLLSARAPLPTHEGYLGWWMMAFVMGAYTMVGFESAANLAEETLDAANIVPKAVIGSVLASGVAGMLFLMVSVLGIDDLATVIASPHPLPLIIEHQLGRTTAMAFFLLIAISIFACGLVILASGSRMVYAMARDGAFLGNRLFRRVSSSTGAPVPAILLVAVLAMVTEIYSESLAQLLAAAAVLPAIVYLVTVVAYFVCYDRLPATLGHFSLGRWGRWVAIAATIWLVFIIGVLSIPEAFHSAAYVSIAICATGIVVYQLLIRHRWNDISSSPTLLNPPLTETSGDS